MRETPTNNIYNKKQYDQRISNINHNYQFNSRILIEKELTHQSPNLMNLSRVSNPPKPVLIASAGLNLETLNTLSNGTNHS